MTVSLIADCMDDVMFRYAEVVIGSKTHQNIILDLSNFKVPVGAVDVFRSIFLFDGNLNLYVNQTGSVLGYSGRCSVDWIPIILNSEEDTLNLTMTKNFLHYLDTIYEISPANIQTAFSPSTEFQILLPAELFGSITPHENLPLIIKGVVLELCDGFKEIDTSIYQHTSLIRFVNTKDSDSGLFKILLTYDEIMNLQADQIRKLATAPRTISDMIPKRDVRENIYLKRIYEKYREYVLSRMRGTN